MLFSLSITHLSSPGYLVILSVVLILTNECQLLAFLHIVFPKSYKKILFAKFHLCNIETFFIP